MYRSFIHQCIDHWLCRPRGRECPLRLSDQEATEACAIRCQSFQHLREEDTWQLSPLICAVAPIKNCSTTPGGSKLCEGLRLKLGALTRFCLHSLNPSSSAVYGFSDLSNINATVPSWNSLIPKYTVANCEIYVSSIEQSIHPSGYTLSTCVHEIDVCNLMLFIRSCSSNEESKVMSQWHAHEKRHARDAQRSNC